MEMKHGGGMLEIKDLRVSYDKGKSFVISGADITLESGTLTALLGLNGSGKSTLLKACCGLLPAASASWTVCGRKGGEMSGRQLASQIAYIPQSHSIIYHVKTLDVVLMGINPGLSFFQTPSAAHRRKAGEMLSYIGLGDKAGTDFLALSEGQKQLVILARALLQEAPVMLFDEPDSALDYENKKRVLGQIAQIVRDKQRAGLITLHDPDYALRYCDKILLLQNGAIKDTIDCRRAGREEVQNKLRTIYPGIRLIECETGFLTLK